MNKNEDLILGFPNLLKKSKKFKINPENFPTKIGGSPVWLIPDKIPKILCNECSNPMKFLLQVLFF